MAKRGGRPPSGGARAAATDDVVDLDPESRPKRFMKSALAILGETGRTDFTVLEVVGAPSEPRAPRGGRLPPSGGSAGLIGLPSALRAAG